MNKLPNVILLACPFAMTSMCLVVMIQTNNTTLVYCMAGIVLVMTIFLLISILNFRTLIHSLNKLYNGSESENVNFCLIAKLTETQKMLHELKRCFNSLATSDVTFNPSPEFIKSDWYTLYEKIHTRQQKSARELLLQQKHQMAESKFVHLLQQQQHNQNADQITGLFLSSLAPYINAQKGLVYVVNQPDKTLQLSASYACDGMESKVVEWGEGMLGQAMYEDKIIQLNNVNEQFMNIHSGLGNTSSSCLIILPVYYNGNPVCALELMLLKELSPEEAIFLKRVVEYLGAALSNLQLSKHTQELLFEAENAASELKKNQHELQLAKEMLSNRLIELQAESNLTSCIVTAINKSNASIEFDMYGTILGANEIFTSMTGYSLEHILGQNERLLLNELDITSEKYDMLWRSLEDGNFITGEFIRKSSNGSDIWLEATYNPILDLQGKPYKVIMYANFTTEAKEKENEYRNKMTLLNESCIYIDLNIDYSIRTCNQKFLDIVKVKRKDLKKINFSDLINIEENNCAGVNLLESCLHNNSKKKLIHLKDSESNLYSFSATVIPNKDLKNEMIGYLMILSPLSFE